MKQCYCEKPSMYGLFCAKSITITTKCYSSICCNVFYMIVVFVFVYDLAWV